MGAEIHIAAPFLALSSARLIPYHFGLFVLVSRKIAILPNQERQTKILTRCYAQNEFHSGDIE
jgi:hypothetical protein